MDMIDEELMRLANRLDDLKLRVIPDYENRTQMIYSRVMSLPKESDERIGLEAEYKTLSSELTRRSDELIETRLQIENLEMEKKFASR